MEPSKPMKYVALRQEMDLLVAEMTAEEQTEADGWYTFLSTGSTPVRRPGRPKGSRMRPPAQVSAPLYPEKACPARSTKPLTARLE